ncbi:MAG: WavE lipopolysaccharide synthesis family protein [Acetobacter sp.]|nr:WavE lipopolysaccharide synthesis family protein [Acetobacter sp.]
MFTVSDISIIIQGSYYPMVTEKVITSVREHLPQAKVIVSTCDKNFPEQMEGCDEFIISPDPGGYTYADRPGEKENNINRQIVNTLTGLKYVKTKYTLKLRSDFLLTGNSFLNFFDKFPLAEPNYQVFGHKILACCYFARNPNSDMPFPFHPSDLAFFGQTEDLLKLFDIPLMTKNQAYWNLKDRHQYQYIPEQYLFINCLRQKGFQVDCNFYNDCRSEGIEQTERFFASNFIFLTFEQFNLQPTKQTFNMKVHPNAFKSCYTHIEWQAIYKKYIDENYDVPLIDEERFKIEKYYKNYKKYRFLSNLCALPFRNKAKRRQIRNAVLEYFLNK